LRVLITGGTGFVGRAVARELTRNNHDVTVLTRREAGEPPAGTVVRGDPTRADIVDQLIGQSDFEGICHLAGLTGIRESLSQPTMYFDVNVGIAVNILKAVRSRYARTGHPARIVFASTRAVYAKAKDELVAETYPAIPASPYGVTKRAVEQLLEFESGMAAIGAISLRCFNVSGADRDIVDHQPRLIPKLIGAIRGTLPPIRLDSPRNRRDFVHVLDVGRAFVAALERSQPGQYRVYNIGSGQGISIEHVVRLLEEVSGRPVPQLAVPESRRDDNAEDPDAGIADISLARRGLGWKPERTIENLIRDAWHFSAAASGEPLRSGQ